MRQPRVADLVADSLRRQVLTGELAEGDRLPPQEELLAHFNVSLPSVREALRILEMEGLVTVQRGNQGGAVVHLPSSRSTAYMQCLVLQSRHVELGDVTAALGRLEPLCAQLCAEREDRMETLVPKLEANLEGEAEHLNSDLALYIRATRAFHSTVVDMCGNETISLIVGGLVLAWSAHEHPPSRPYTKEGEFPTPVLRARNLEVHRNLLDTIRSGDGPAAAVAYGRHLAVNRAQHSALDGVPVDANLLRQLLRSDGSPPLRPES